MSPNEKRRTVCQSSIKACRIRAGIASTMLSLCPNVAGRSGLGRFVVNVGQSFMSLARQKGYVQDAGKKMPQAISGMNTIGCKTAKAERLRLKIVSGSLSVRKGL